MNQLQGSWTAFLGKKFCALSIVFTMNQGASRMEIQNVPSATRIRIGLRHRQSTVRNYGASILN